MEKQLWAEMPSSCVLGSQGLMVAAFSAFTAAGANPLPYPPLPAPGAARGTQLPEKPDSEGRGAGPTSGFQYKNTGEHLFCYYSC